MKINTFIIVSGALLVVVIAGAVFMSATSGNNKPQKTPDSQPEGPIVTEVRMTEDSYEPAKFTIKSGQAVRFVNASKSKQLWPASNIHPSHDLYPEFDVKRGMMPGEQWVFTFRRPGNWRMHDHLYPFIKGTITVE